MRTMAGRATRLFPAAALEFEASPDDAPSDTMLALERALYLAIQDMLDVVAMLLTVQERAQAETYRDMVRKLSERGVFVQADADACLAMASFRNLLAHEYVRFEYQRLLSYAAHMDDFEAFARDVILYLDRTDETPPSAGT
jgi:uncharacterized protein YutE (UPF0331/DUF86 family)